VGLSPPFSEGFQLLSAIEPDRDGAVHRFSVTQLINYQRCPRQYYFDRVLHLPAADQIAVWNDAEAPEPPANLTATLKGAVIHRFCEMYATGDHPEELLRKSFADVLRMRQAELADRLVEINTDAGIAELLPLAENYLSSAVFERVERARAMSEPPALAGGNLERLRSNFPSGLRLEAGLWSELSFRLRRPLGILSGALDKLLITPAANGKGFDVEIIDFKTNRLRPRHSTSSLGSRAPRGPQRGSPVGVVRPVLIGGQTIWTDRNVCPTKRPAKYRRSLSFEDFVVWSTAFRRVCLHDWPCLKPTTN
jgi:hypothetical protein